MCTDFAKALEALREKVQRLCSSKEWEELRVDFSDLRTRALSIKAQVPAACVCAEVKEERTLQQIQQARIAPLFPDHPVAPPPPDFFEGVNE